MKKNLIVKKNWEFQEIINKKQQFISKTLILYHINSDKFQIGISIPKKFANAVLRNYLKRQIKAIIDQEISIGLINKKIVLIVRKSFINLSFIDKKNELMKIFNKLD